MEVYGVAYSEVACRLTGIICRKRLPKPWVSFVETKNRVMRIIRGKYGRRRFEVPKNITARPTTDFARENLFNVLENLDDFEGKTALDLFLKHGSHQF